MPCESRAFLFDGARLGRRNVRFGNLFGVGRLNVFQSLLIKPTPRKSDLHLTRADWYL